MLTLSHQTGVLSNVLSAFSAIGVSILTISQSLPVNDQASVMLTADMQNASCAADEVMQKVAKVNGVKQVLLLSMS
jgi:chorismate mutase